MWTQTLNITIEGLLLDLFLLFDVFAPIHLYQWIIRTLIDVNKCRFFFHFIPHFLLLIHESSFIQFIIIFFFKKEQIELFFLFYEDCMVIQLLLSSQLNTTTPTTSKPYWRWRLGGLRPTKNKIIRPVSKSRQYHAYV